MKTKKYFFLVVIIMMIGWVIPLRLSAQFGESYPPGMAATLYVPGYVLFGNSDTIFGRVKWSLKYVENNPVEIKFTDKNGIQKVYTASEIRGFGNMIGQQWDDYESMPSFKKGVQVFILRLMAGRITVYLNRSSMGLSSSTTVERSRMDGIGFYFEPGEGLTIGPTYHTDVKVINAKSRYTSYYVRKDFGRVEKIDKDSYESQLKELFSDCQAVADELNKNPELGKFKNFMILTEVYNRLCTIK